jgi:hypothetical protein
MVFFSITYQTNPTAIKPGDQDFFRILNCEAGARPNPDDEGETIRK